MPEAGDYTEEGLEKYFTAQVLLPAGESDLVGTMKQRKRDANGNPIGVPESNPILNTQ